MPNIKSLSLKAKVIAKVKVDNKQTNEQTDRQTNRQDKNNMPRSFDPGHKKFVEILTSEWKKNHFFLQSCVSFLCIWFVAVAIRSGEVSGKRRPSATYVCPQWVRILADLAEKQQHLYRTMSTPCIPSFIQIHQGVLEKKPKM